MQLIGVVMVLFISSVILNRKIHIFNFKRRSFEMNYFVKLILALFFLTTLLSCTYYHDYNYKYSFYRFIDPFYDLYNTGPCIINGPVIDCIWDENSRTNN